MLLCLWCLRCALDGILLHVFVHVSILHSVRHLFKVGVSEMLRLVSHVGAEVSIHDALLGWFVLLVEILLDVRRAVLLDGDFPTACDTIGGPLLHVLDHVRVLGRSLAVQNGKAWV